MIEKLLNIETIEVNIAAESWEDGVRAGGALLRKAGKIESSYIDAMVENVKELGSYIVIAKGIAMPHARPERGAKDIGLSLVTLKDPICFGNIENDPVKAIISFCAKDSTSHMEILSELMDLFEDEQFQQLIYTAKTKEEIIAYIQSKKFYKYTN